MTRLRFHLVNKSKINEQQLKALDGVAGATNKAGQYQVVVGTDVADIYKELPLSQKKRSAASVKSKQEKKGWLSTFFDTITSIFTPILPAIIGARMLKAFLSLFVALKLLETTSQSYVILNNLGDTVFYYMPIFVGYSAVKRFSANPFVGAAVGAFLVNPEIVSLLTGKDAVSLFGVPVVSANYASSVGCIMQFYQLPYQSFLQMAMKLLLPQVCLFQVRLWQPQLLLFH